MSYRRPPWFAHGAAALVAVGALVASSRLVGAQPAAPICPRAKNAIVVLTAERALHLCEGGSSVARHGVALGSGGLGKLREGDRKTPLGAYPLGAPRPSKKFGTFIPVAYPTAVQREAGLTGGDIGVHGPKRELRALGSLSTAVDWTRGCIAVGSDAQIDAIAAWTRDKKPELIEIR